MELLHHWHDLIINLHVELHPSPPPPPPPPPQKKNSPPSAMKVFIKKSLHVFLGRNYALAPLENYVGVYAPQYLKENAG